MRSIKSKSNIFVSTALFLAILTPSITFAAPKAPVKANSQPAPKIDEQQALINKYVTTYETLSFVKVPVVKADIYKVLPANFRPNLETYLNVAGPIGFIDGYIIINGCKAHNCDTDQAEIWYNPYSKDVIIRLMVNGVTTIYSNAEWQYLPKNLKLILMGYKVPEKQPAYIVKVAK